MCILFEFSVGRLSVKLMAQFFLHFSGCIPFCFFSDKKQTNQKSYFSLYRVNICRALPLCVPVTDVLYSGAIDGGLVTVKL
jgi:hypothetical protein